jgi:hypothetical protein
MRQAREIERETYASRDKRKHGGSIGRMGMQLLEWFAYVLWPKARNGMYPSLAHIAEGARMSKESVVQAPAVMSSVSQEGSVNWPCPRSANHQGQVGCRLRRPIIILLIKNGRSTGTR